MPKGKAKKEKIEEEVVSVELPAPEGWIKKFTPKQGGTPRRNEVVFISPTGEEIHSKKQLDQYLRSHPGGPPSSSFDWGTGDTPRRSTRISEKVKISPEAEMPRRTARSSEKVKTSEEKPKRAGRSSEKAKTSPELEKTAAGSSVSQKATKRKKKIEYNRDETEEEAYIDEGDAPKDGDMEDAKGLKKVKRRKKNTEEDEHKAEGEEHSADVVMEESEGPELTKESVDERVEPPVEIQAAIEHKLTDKAEENADEKVEPTEVLPAAVSESEKDAFVESGSAKDEDFETEGTDHNKSKEEAIVETEKIEENVQQSKEIQDEIKHDFTEKIKENADVEKSEGPEHSRVVGEGSVEGVHGLAEHKSTDKMKESVPITIEHESPDKIEENVEEGVVPDVIEEEAEGMDHKHSTEEFIGVRNFTEEAIGEESYSLLDVVSTGKAAIEEELASVTDLTAVATMEKHLESQIDIEPEWADKANEKVNELEQLDGKCTEFEPGQEVVKDFEAYVGMEDAETYSVNGGNMDKDVRSTQNDTFEPLKGIEDKPIVAERCIFIEQHVEVSATKNDEASMGITEAVMFSENGGKEEEAIAALDDFLQDFDDENTQVGSSPSNL